MTWKHNALSNDTRFIIIVSRRLFLNIYWKSRILHWALMGLRPECRNCRPRHLTVATAKPARPRCTSFSSNYTLWRSHYILSLGQLAPLRGKLAKKKCPYILIFYCYTKYFYKKMTYSQLWEEIISFLMTILLPKFIV